MPTYRVDLQLQQPGCQPYRKCVFARDEKDVYEIIAREFPPGTKVLDVGELDNAALTRIADENAANLRSPVTPEVSFMKLFKVDLVLSDGVGVFWKHVVAETPDAAKDIARSYFPGASAVTATAVHDQVLARHEVAEKPLYAEKGSTRVREGRATKEVRESVCEVTNPPTHAYSVTLVGPARGHRRVIIIARDIADAERASLQAMTESGWAVVTITKIDSDRRPLLFSTVAIAVDNTTEPTEEWKAADERLKRKAEAVSVGYDWREEARQMREEAAVRERRAKTQEQMGYSAVPSGGVPGPNRNEDEFKVGPEDKSRIEAAERKRRAMATQATKSLTEGSYHSQVRDMIHRRRHKTPNQDAGSKAYGDELRKAAAEHAATPCGQFDIQFDISKSIKAALDEIIARCRTEEMRSRPDVHKVYVELHSLLVRISDVLGVNLPPGWCELPAGTPKHVIGRPLDAWSFTDNVAYTGVAPPEALDYADRPVTMHFQFATPDGDENVSLSPRTTGDLLNRIASEEMNRASLHVELHDRVDCLALRDLADQLARTTFATKK